MLSGFLVGFVLGVVAWWVAARLIYRSPRWRAEVARRWRSVEPDDGEAPPHLAVRVDAGLTRVLLALAPRHAELSSAALSLVGGLEGFAVGRALRGAPLTWSGTYMSPRECADLSRELRDGVGIAEFLPYRDADALGVELAEALTGRAVQLHVGRGLVVESNESGPRYAFSCCACGALHGWSQERDVAAREAQRAGWHLGDGAECPVCVGAS